MLFQDSLCSFQTFTNNWGTNPSATPGTSITSGGSANTKGSYVQALTALASDAYGIHVRISDIGTAASNREYLVDVGVDPAGGTSYTVQIPDLNCGQAPPITAGVGYLFYFPLYIPAGATVGVRGQCNNTSVTARVGVQVDHLPTRPEVWPRGNSVERIGTITNSRGVSFTPGNAADGSWVSLGTLTRACSWVQLGPAVSNSVITAERTYVDLGVGDGSNKLVLMRHLWSGGGGNEQVSEIMFVNLLWSRCYRPLPAGAELWVRGRCENAPDTGYNALAYALAA